MLKTRIEVCADVEWAQLRAEWLRQRGYDVELEERSKVIVVGSQLGGDQRVYEDDDGSVWLVVGTKGGP